MPSSNECGQSAIYYAIGIDATGVRDVPLGACTCAFDHPVCQTWFKVSSIVLRVIVRRMIHPHCGSGVSAWRGRAMPPVFAKLAPLSQIIENYASEAVVARQGP